MCGDGSRAAAAHDPVRREDHDSRYDEILDITKVVVEGLVIGADRPADARQDGAPDPVADQRQQVVAPEIDLEDPGRDRDERAGHGRDPADQHRPALPALEPALGAVELARREVEPPPVALEQPAAAAEPEPPADHGPDLVADDPGE